VAEVAGSRFLWGGVGDWQCLEELDVDDEIVARYTYAPGYIDAVAVQERDLNSDNDFADDDEVVYYHSSTLYSVYALSDASETVIERYRYDAYGACTVLDADGSVDGDGLSDVENPYLFTARRLDVESGLMQHRHREYDSDLGRFVGRDATGHADSANLYVYNWQPNADVAFWQAYPNFDPATQSVYVTPDGRLVPVPRLQPLPPGWWLTPEPGWLAGASWGLRDLTAPRTGRPRPVRSSFFASVAVDPDCCSEVKVIQIVKTTRKNLGLWMSGLWHIDATGRDRLFYEYQDPPIVGAPSVTVPWGDDPGFPPPRLLLWGVHQVFETCLVCMEEGDQCGMVLACIVWSHKWVWRFPKWRLVYRTVQGQSGTNLAGGSLTFSRPSGTFQDVVGTELGAECLRLSATD